MIATTAPPVGSGSGDAATLALGAIMAAVAGDVKVTAIAREIAQRMERDTKRRSINVVGIIRLQTRQRPIIRGGRFPPKPIILEGRNCV